MERYLQLAALGLALATFIPAFIFCFRAVKHFIQMLSHFRSERHYVTAGLLPFLIPFMPQFFTEQGNIHRAEFVANMSRFLGCVAFIALVYGLLGIP